MTRQKTAPAPQAPAPQDTAALLAALIAALPTGIRHLTLEDAGYGRADLSGWRDRPGMGADLTLAQNVPAPLALALRDLLAAQIGLPEQQVQRPQPGTAPARPETLADVVTLLARWLTLRREIESADEVWTRWEELRAQALPLDRQLLALDPAHLLALAGAEQ